MNCQRQPRVCWFWTVFVLALSVLRTGEQTVRAAAPVYRASGSVVTIDSQQRVIVNGQPMFVRGFFSSSEQEDMDRIAAAGFNTIVCYGYGRGENPRAFLDRAQQAGLWVLYCLTSFRSPDQAPDACAQYVRPLKDHPAMLGWYINDEGKPTEAQKQHLATMYRAVKDEDPHHPAVVLINHVNQASFYKDVTDILVSDPYPVPNEPLTIVTQWVNLCRAGVNDRKPVWCAPQLHALGVYYAGFPDTPGSRRKTPENIRLREPTFEEQRCMTYLALLAETRGLLYYSYMDLMRRPGRQNENDYNFERRWSQMRQIGRELSELEPVLLDGEPVELGEITCTVNGEAVAADQRLQVRALRHDGKLYVMVASPSPDVDAIEVFINPPPGAWRLDHLTEGAILATMTDHRLHLALGRYGCDTAVLEPQ